MPTPLELITDPTSLIIFAVYGALMLWEAFSPGRPLARDHRWKIKGLAAFAAFFFISSYLPLIWSESLATYQLFDLTGLGTLGGAIVGILVYECGVYVWHRSLHKSDFLWKHLHRTHHSAHRLDTYGAFYFSPLDMVGWTVLSSLCLTLIVGLSPQSTMWVLIVTNFFSIFQHSNIKTPRWLGYIIQRPESHTYHHARDIHRDNYSDLPVFDLLFGTFKNPERFEHEVGLSAGFAQRYGAGTVTAILGEQKT